MSGTVTYRERIALTPGASAGGGVAGRVVGRCCRSADCAADHCQSRAGANRISRSSINREDIKSRNTYAIQARIIESDGRLAFINDTAYDVITRGNPSRVDMLLVLVQPPPDQVEEGEDWRKWVEVPVPVVWANLIPNEAEHYLRIAYYQSTIEGCARPGNEGLRVDGRRHHCHGHIDATAANQVGDSVP